MAEQQTAMLFMSEFVTHDVKHLSINHPAGYSFAPGQGVEFTIKQDRWANEPRPFTPALLHNDLMCDFTNKHYPAGDELLLSDSFGPIRYQGPGVFVAGNACRNCY